jgi:hypothetical protein
MTALLEERHGAHLPEPSALNASACTGEGGAEYLNELPVLATASDLREVVRYLRKRPGGVFVHEEWDKGRKRLFHRKKVAAYALLGMTCGGGDSVELSPAGLDLADSLESDAREFRWLIDRVPLYRAALEQARGQRLDVLTAADVLRFWGERRPESFYHDDDARRGAVISFFSFCQAAGLGTTTLGKRGHVTRLRIDIEELEGFLDERLEPRQCQLAPDGTGTRERAVAPLRALIAHGVEQEATAPLRQMLELIGVEWRLSAIDWGRGGESESTWPPDCDVAVLVLDDGAYEQDCDGRRVLREPVLLGVGAALVVYNRRAILFGDGSLPAPTSLAALPCFGFEGQSQTWEAGVELLKTFERFKEEARR